MRPKGTYGIDAPRIPLLWAALALLFAAGALVVASFPSRWWTVALACYLAASALVYVSGAVLSWHASLRGKFVVWQRVLQAVPDGAVSTALDLGCGRGAVAIQTALRFPRAHITGIDLWRRTDQSGNTEAALRANAAANGVHLTVVTGTMTRLPFDDGSMDLVTAGMSIHNIPTRAGRAAALAEAARVLAPGGRMLVVDIQRAGEYADELARLGLAVSGPERLGWRMWWTGPWMATSLVRAVR
jgi:arsenite methyltransferase